MASLAESNSYLQNKEIRRKMVAENTFDSSVFERASPRSLESRVGQSSDKRRSKASTKKLCKAP